MMIEKYSIEGAQKDVSSVGGTTLKKVYKVANWALQYHKINNDNTRLLALAN